MKCEYCNKEDVDVMDVLGAIEEGELCICWCNVCNKYIYEVINYEDKK